MLADFQKEYLDKCRQNAERLRLAAMKAQQECALFTLAEFLHEAAFVIETGIVQEERKQSMIGTLAEQNNVHRKTDPKKGSTSETSPSLFPKTSPASKEE